MENGSENVVPNTWLLRLLALCGGLPTIHRFL
jgi:hypothetical protein